MVKALVLFLAVIIGINCSINLWFVLTELFSQFSSVSLWFIGGCVVSTLLLVVYKKKFEFFTTFEHELTHNIWAMIFFRKPMGFHVNRDGSGLFEFKQGGKFSDIFISLAPYFFPTACFLWLPFHIMCKEEYMWFYFLLMGVFFGYQVVSTIQETGSYQSDIKGNGVIYSYCVFIPLYIAFHGVVLSHLSNGFSGVADFLIWDSYNNVKLLFELTGLG
jgi:hypothetical protein